MSLRVRSKCESYCGDSQPLSLRVLKPWMHGAKTLGLRGQGHGFPENSAIFISDNTEIKEARDEYGRVFGGTRPCSSQPKLRPLKPAHSKRQPRPATEPPRGVRLARAGAGAARLARLEVRTTAQQPQRDEQRGEREGQRREPGVEVWQRGDRRRLPAQVVGRLGRGLRWGRRRAGQRAGRRAARSVPLGGGARRRR